MKIFLVGYMGCGKTTIGKKMSKLLKYRFLDLDLFLEDFYGKSIPEIFKEEGEFSFREKEKTMLAMVISSDEDLVVSTGGGTPCFYNNINLMNDAGFTIYLNASPDVLVQRLMSAKDERPIIEGKSKEELKEFIQNHLAQRSAYYNKAKLTVNASNFGNKELEALIKKIV